VFSQVEPKFQGSQGRRIQCPIFNGFPRGGAGVQNFHGLKKLSRIFHAVEKIFHAMETFFHGVEVPDFWMEGARLRP
jgi:hypothetical protein